MEFVYFTLLFSIVMIIINYSQIFVGLFDFFIRIPFISEQPILVQPSVRQQLDNLKSNLTYFGNPIMILFIIFYIIFYIIYIIIKTIVPDTGIQTFFIPLKELLLKIPPLPSLEKFGIFRLIECIIDAFGITPALKGFIKFNLCFIDFSRDNIRTILKMFFLDTEINLGDDNNKSDNKKEKEKEKKETIVHKQINEDVNICYKNNRIPYKIGMSEAEKQKLDFSNNQIFIKCKSNSIGKYIRII
jgi:hypothetical protein